MDDLRSEPLTRRRSLLGAQLSDLNPAGEVIYTGDEIFVLGFL